MRSQDKKAVASNIEAQAKYASILFIWTDCDREGEHIGTEIRDIALRANPNMQVWRARFSNIERASVSLHHGKVMYTNLPQTCHTCLSESYSPR
jgi:DNA topoisomerase IA